MGGEESVSKGDDFEPDGHTRSWYIHIAMRHAYMCVGMCPPGQLELTFTVFARSLNVFGAPEKKRTRIDANPGPSLSHTVQEN